MAPEKPVTANLTRVSLAPVEYFTRKRASAARHHLLSSGWRKMTENQLVTTIHELCDSSTELYVPACVDAAYTAGMFVAFIGSSACLVRTARAQDWPVTADAVKRQCVERKALHVGAIQHQLAFFETAGGLLALDDEWPVKLNYVFTYYIAECARQLPPDVVDVAKILAEPSLADMDDMLSADTDDQATQAFSLGQKSASMLATIADADLGDGRQVFITWESMLCIEHTNTTRKFFDLLLALEIRLQATWNKCFTLSNYVDSVFAAQNSPGKSSIEELYWDFARTLHSAKEVAASTASARVNAIFLEMSRTSALHEQIDRLSGKLTLLSHFIQWKRDKVNSRYQKMISLLLLLAAMGAALPAFFNIPIFKDPRIGDLVFAGAAVVGLVAIALGG